MRERLLGRHGLVAPALGLGCMSMSELYGVPDEGEAIRTLRRALELGVTLLDTADVYGSGGNERLLARALAGSRDEAILATKVGVLRAEDGSWAGYCGRPEYVRACCDASLRRLATDVIDLYQLHRVDPAVPIEETVGAMQELVAAGKVRYLGLSEAHPVDIRRAAATADISTLQNEWSLFEREIEDDVLPTCEELGIGILAYAPLGRGMLTARYTSLAGLDAGDWRHGGPRWQPGNLEANLALVARVQALAADRGCTPGQLALAWLLHRAAHVVPIPGTRRVAWLEENAVAADIALGAEDLAALQAAVPRHAVAGPRRRPERSPTWISPPLPAA